MTPEERVKKFIEALKASGAEMTATGQAFLRVLESGKLCDAEIEKMAQMFDDYMLLQNEKLRQGIVTREQAETLLGVHESMADDEWIDGVDWRDVDFVVYDALRKLTEVEDDS
jgi:hypothetical protein